MITVGFTWYIIYKKLLCGCWALGMRVLQGDLGGQLCMPRMEVKESLCMRQSQNHIHTWYQGQIPGSGVGKVQLSVKHVLSM
jgi:hypothetical protein